MQVNEVYEQYCVPPHLQAHMLRVAGVADYIAGQFHSELPRAHMRSACLLHDVANIIKFNFDWQPEIWQGRVEEWKRVQAQMRSRYGDDEHAATLHIAKEVGVSEKTERIIGAIGFSKACALRGENTFEKKICCYADQRVASSGVCSLEERIAEGGRRHALNKGDGAHDSKYENAVACLHTLEEHIFAHTAITPTDITESVIFPLLPELRVAPLV